MQAQNTLLLDAVYAPISIIPWTRAITLLWLGKVEVVEEYDRVVRSPSVAIRLPAVVRLVRRIVRGRRRVRLSRQNIFLHAINAIAHFFLTRQWVDDTCLENNSCAFIPVE